MTPTLETERLLMRPWREADAVDALSIYGDGEVMRWLAPTLNQVPDVQTMREVLDRWQAQDVAPASHWAAERRDNQRVVGGMALLHLAPWEDWEIGWQLARAAWGHGYATEAAAALARWAMHTGGIEELFALVGPGNRRAAATAQRLGMEWIEETDQYHQQHLELYRLRHSDLAYCETCGGDA